MLKLFKAKSLKKTRETENISLNERTQEKNKKQKGRSMVEMLGVLAIIGVLSIGGIQGYTMAMRKYRANEILNLLSKYALTVYTGCQASIENGVPFYGSYNYTYEADHDFEFEDDNISMIDDENFWRCPVTSFTDAGLGNLPNGVEIGFYTVPYAGYSHCTSYNKSPNPCKPGISILSRSSGDVVVIEVLFKDKTLCETVSAQFGDNPCYKSDYSDKYMAVFSTIMN